MSEREKAQASQVEGAEIVDDEEEELISERVPPISKYCGLPLEVTNDLPPKSGERVGSYLRIGVVFRASCGVCGYRREWRRFLKLLVKGETP